MVIARRVIGECDEFGSPMIYAMIGDIGRIVYIGEPLETAEGVLERLPTVAWSNGTTACTPDEIQLLDETPCH